MLLEFVISSTSSIVEYAGFISSVIFSNDSSNYAVLLLRQADNELIITGPLSDCDIGDYVQVSGEWITHPVHKKQLKVHDYSHLVPRSNDELLLFLSSGAISGIGPHFAKKMVDHFGDELIVILDKSPNRLTEVSGIGIKKVESIIPSWKMHRQQLSFLQYMLQFSVDIQLSKRIWNTYFYDAFEVVKERPYQLIQSVKGIDFTVADRIGNLQGLGPTDDRFYAAMHDVFSKYHQRSDVWMPMAQFLKQLNDRLGMPLDDLNERVNHAIFQQMLSSVIDNEDHWVTTPLFSQTELSIMDAVAALQSSPASILIDSDKAVTWVLPRLKQALSQDQVDALSGLCANKVSILYGGPGTGKTSLLRAFVHIVSKKTDQIVCMAPTGKAAKRLGDQIGRYAGTIHSYMDYDEKTHALSPRPLNCDVCIIDEMSMVDMTLFFDVLQMIPVGAKVVLVGDPDQLPSIGPGQVFNDFICHSTVPKFQLTTNHRQTNFQGITKLASHIQQRMPIGLDGIDHDLSLIHITDDQLLSDRIEQLLVHESPKADQVSMDDIQVLAPIRKGALGITQLNYLLAKRVRPPMPNFPPWVVGDRVIQCRNNYSKKVMNGDIGFIKSITNDQISILFDQRLIQFEPSEMSDIQLAYAVSIHKFQGSEAPVIILPIIKQWGFFMSMDVLYTAVTRAKAHLYILGDMNVFNKLLETSKKTVRHTFLFQ